MDLTNHGTCGRKLNELLAKVPVTKIQAITIALNTTQFYPDQFYLPVFSERDRLKRRQKMSQELDFVTDNVYTVLIGLDRYSLQLSARCRGGESFVGEIGEGERIKDRI